jgi:hypothetical protein
MANFESVPDRKNINGLTVTVNGPSVTVGLYGPKYAEGKELDVLNKGEDLMIREAGQKGDVKFYTLTVKPSVQATKTEVSDEIFANTQEWQTWSSFKIVFKFKKVEASSLVVRTVSHEIFGGPADNPWRTAPTSEFKAISMATFLPGRADNKPKFVPVGSVTTEIAIFAAKMGASERAFLVMRPPNTSPKKLLFVVSHGFGQSHAYYNALGYSNPLSKPLMHDVFDRFVLGRWGNQLLAATSDYALVMPVRAGGGGSEYGPFMSTPGLCTQVIARIIGLTKGGIGADEVDVVTFSSGISDTHLFLGTGGKGLNFNRGINQDPAGAVGMPNLVKIKKQYLSGQTGGPFPGFEFMPMDRWENEEHFADKYNMDTFNYLHTWCIPQHTLYLAYKT